MRAWSGSALVGSTGLRSCGRYSIVLAAAASAIAPAGPSSTTVRYVGETAVLEYDWRTDTGRAIARVCMAWPVTGGRQCLLWLVHVVAGEIDLEVSFAPRPGFGQELAQIDVDDDGVRIITTTGAMRFTSSIPLASATGEVCQWSAAVEREGSYLIATTSSRARSR